RNSQLGSESISHMRRIGITHCGLQRVGLHVWSEPQMLLDQLRDLLHQSIGPHALFADNGRAADERSERAVVVLDANCRRALAAFDDDFDLAVLLLLRLENPRNRADAVN